LSAAHTQAQVSRLLQGLAGCLALEPTDE